MGKQAVFSVGQLVKHSLFEYRGVIVDVDPQFMLTDQWYDLMAKSRPPKSEPWYRVLVHGGQHETYVAERNLEACGTGQPVNNPAIEKHFDNFEDGKYILNKNHAN